MENVYITVPEDCAGSKLYCDNSQALNYNESGNCRMPTVFTDGDINTEGSLKKAVQEWL